MAIQILWESDVQEKVSTFPGKKGKHSLANRHTTQ